MKRVYLLVPGIYTSPSDNHNWAPRLATRINCSTPYKGDEFRYFSTAVFRRIHQQRNAEALAESIECYGEHGYDIVGVAHSNGNDLFCRALRLIDPKYRIRVLHMFAAACDASFKDNGLNSALFNERLGRAEVYVSKKDSALGRWARLSQLAKPFGLGFGDLGYEGPKDIMPELASRVCVHERDYRHGEWLGSRIDESFQSMTMPHWEDISSDLPCHR